MKNKKSIWQLIEEGKASDAAMIKAHDEKPYNWESTNIVRDSDGKPLVCGCGSPIEDSFPWPCDIPERSCYLCTAKWMRENEIKWPEELKPGETNNPPIMGQRLKREAVWTKYTGG